MQQDVTATRPADPPAPSRRQLLSCATACAASLAGAAVLAACGSSSSDAKSAAETTAGAGSTIPAGTTVAAVADVPVGGAVVVQLGDQPVAVSMKTANTPTAFSARCTHQGVTVAPQGAALVCPRHGSTFDAFTGAVERSPAASPLPAIAVKISGTNIVTA